MHIKKENLLKQRFTALIALEQKIFAMGFFLDIESASFKPWTGAVEAWCQSNIYKVD
jgi:hypothetical protein